MANIYCVIIINKFGSLIYHYEERAQVYEATSSYQYPLPFKFKEYNETYEVIFGETDTVKGKHIAQSVGFTLTKINNRPPTLEATNGRNLQEFLDDCQNYPLTLTFSKSGPSMNEKITIASTLHS
ncbi:Trafficking protein particle complex subunit 4 [Thelohanellus kitauei]|uniref:Trafficking protein particle complex subunit 4 n=1 Tax=Thelohanellus kitauei TaxID=669202 RepID=A0A0C2JIJ4_THEKT|nr:Trafficking protein particle complex subunit 4 [Thelohanellus kitauei]